MRNIEFGRAIDYSRNILSHTFGIAGYRSMRDGAIESNDTTNPKVVGGLGFTNELLFPATWRFLPRIDDEGQKNIVLKHYSRGALDMASNVGALYLMTTGRAAEGVAVKIAYNMAVAVTPDVVRSMKQTFQNFRTKPPSAAIV